MSACSTGGRGPRCGRCMPARRSGPAKWDYDPNDIQERQRRRAAMTAELPCFLRFLQTFHIPAKQVDRRYGVKRFHDPALVARIRELQEETQLWNLIHELQIWGVDDE